MQRYTGIFFDGDVHACATSRSWKVKASGRATTGWQIGRTNFSASRSLAASRQSAIDAGAVGVVCHSDFNSIDQRLIVVPRVPVNFSKCRESWSRAVCGNWTKKKKKIIIVRLWKFARGVGQVASCSRSCCRSIILSRTKERGVEECVVRLAPLLRACYAIVAARYNEVEDEREFYCEWK